MGTPEAVDRIVGWARRGPRSSVVDAVEVFASEGAFDFLTHDQRNRSPVAFDFAIDPTSGWRERCRAPLSRSSHPPADARARVARTWQWLGDLADSTCRAPLAARDVGRSSDEPLLLARDTAGALRCLSNVCTHRGNILVRERCRAEQIRCSYHSRRFDLAGRMTFMPGFESRRTSPDLRTTCLVFRSATSWGRHLHRSLRRRPSKPSSRRSARAWRGCRSATPPRSVPRPDFEIAAHWALYVENYLEGLHIPFLHPGLNEVLDMERYEYHLGATAACSSRGRARATPLSSRRPPRPTMASGSWRTTGGCSRT